MTYYINHKGGKILSVLMQDIPSLNIKKLSNYKQIMKRDRVNITFHDYHSSHYDVYKDGFTYKGDMKDGQKDGLGRCYDQNNKLIYSGYWENDMLNGWASKYNQYGKRIYTGQWLNGLPHGWGVEYTPDNQILYSGKWEKGVCA
jgi:antitoxin component YwqK of YwqJK toxin-antitoxin module